MGRIVLPKQIREELKINDFDEFEISISNDNIVLKKCVSIEKYKDKFDRLLFLLANILKIKIIITDKSRIISTNDVSIEYNDLIKNVSRNFPIIVNSNILGYMYFICDTSLTEDNKLLKNIRDVFTDLID